MVDIDLMFLEGKVESGGLEVFEVRSERFCYCVEVVGDGKEDLRFPRI